MHQSISLFAILLSFWSVSVAQSQHSCEVARFVEHVEFKNKKLVQIDTVVLQVNARQGERYTEVKIPFSDNKKLSELKVWLEDAEGKLLRVVGKDEIGEQSLVAGSVLYQDDFLKTFKVKHNTYPYKVCYTYKYTTLQFIDWASWSPCLFPNIPTRDARLDIRFPKGIPFQKYVRKVQCVQADTTGDVYRYVFQGKYDSLVSQELFAESITNKIPVVFVAPIQFKYGVEGSHASWQTLGEWIFQLNKGTNDLPDTERQTALQLIKGVTDTVEIVKRLYHYMQDHTRYINVFIGIGGIKSYPASYVTQNRYGDCKALTYYMKALLDCVGISSNVIVLYGEIQPNYLEEDFVHSQFTHMLLAVPLRKDTIWLENTSNTHPFGYVGAFIQNRKALWVAHQSSHIVQLPHLQERDVAVYRKVDVHIDEKSETSIKLDFSLSGIGFGLYTSSSKDAVSRYISAELGIEQTELLNWNIYNESRDTARTILRAQMKTLGSVKKLQDDMYFNAFAIANLPFEPPARRSRAVHLPYPVYIEDSATYYLPVSHNLKALPESVELSSQYGVYSFSCKQDGSRIFVRKKILLYAQLCPINDYKYFYGFYQSIKDSEKKILFVLKKKSS